MEDFRIPDKIGDPLKAWRAWEVEIEVTDGKPEIVLASINQKTRDNKPFAWHPRQIMTGICNGSRKDDHPDSETPYEGCGCGIHALDTPLFLAKAGYVSFIGPNRDKFIWGELQMWGKVINGSTGIKAQYAYPEKFYIRPDLRLSYTLPSNGIVTLDVWTIRDILMQQWGVPVQVVRTAKRVSKESNEVVITEYPEP
jgi:hypothetical protein